MKISKVILKAFFYLCVVFYLLNTFLQNEDGNALSVEYPQYQYENYKNYKNYKNTELPSENSAKKTFFVTFKNFSMSEVNIPSVHRSKVVRPFLKDFGKHKYNRKNF